MKHPSRTRLSLAIAATLTAGYVPTINAQQQIEEIVVVGNIVEGERRAIEAQRNANRILNVISADGIGKLPDNNAAEAVQRVPGVSIERDQGEGRFVAVRGLPSQWNSTTLNGSRLPTAEEETTSRATAFDFFPADLIEQVEVSKALTPDMEGDALGGNVNFVTRTAPNDFILNTTLASNYNSKTDEYGYRGSVLYGDRSDDGRFGFLINATTWQREWATDNFEPRRGGDGIGIRRLELRDYTGVRDTQGVNGAVEYRPNDDTRIYARGQYGTLSDDETHYKHRYRFDKDRVEVQNIFDELITEFRTFEIGGEHFGNGNKLDWSLSTADNEFRYGCIPNCEDRAYFVARFDQRNVGYVGLDDRGAGNLSYNTVDGGSVPGNVPSTHLPAGFAMDPSQTALAWVELYKVDVQEKDRIVASVDYEWEWNADTTLKFGAKYRDKERNARFADEFYAWDDSVGPAPTLADFQLIDQPGRHEYDIGTANIYSDDFSQVIPRDQLLSWYGSNRQNLVLVPDESALVSNGGALGRDFDVTEDHFALYGMATWAPNDRWQVVGGLRVERTDTTVNGRVLQTNDTTGTSELVPNVGEKDYTSVLPQLQARYSISPDTQLRMAFSRSFARPDFGNINPGGTFAEHDGEFFSGNAELEPTYANSLDLMLEHYIGAIGLVSAGVFYKDITDPIFQGSTVGTFRGTSGIRFFQPDNGDDADLTGAEFAFSRQFDFLEGFWSNFGVNANLTVMDSEMTIPGRAGSVAIPRQADTLYNATLYYDDGRFAARLALNHKGEFIEEHGSDAASDSYYGEFTGLDFSASFNLNNQLTLFAEVSNLTDEKLIYYLGQEARPLQVEYYDLRGQFGIRYSF